MSETDLISRQDAIDRINKQREHLQPDVYSQDYIGDAAYRICAEFIGRLPSAQPEKRRGEWSEAERQKSEVFFCSACGGRAYHPWTGDRKDNRKNVCRYKFCPNCGADMRGEKE